ncbi:TonB-dependent receptor [Leptonema illini]|nr:TonB-dependent receptor [Leptonema illini]
MSRRKVFLTLKSRFWNRLLHISAVALLIPGALLAEVAVSGAITVNGRPLVDARIVVEESRSSATTDSGGRFAIAVPASGFYTLRVYTPGGMQSIRREIRPGAFLQITLREEVASEDGFFVLGNRDRTRLSRYSLDKEELRRFPGVYGDSLKAVQSLPGVSPATPVGVSPTANLTSQLKAAGISIGPPYSNSTNGSVVLRGSSARGSRFFLDGFLLPYPFHLGDQASVVNNDFIQGIDVYTGAFPARYGLATGGIVAIRAPDAETITKPSGHFNLAFFLSDAHYEAPLYDSEGVKIYFAGAARKSYPNYVLLQTAPQTIPPNAKFADYADGQFKIGMKTTAHEISLLYAGARDRLRYTQAVAQADKERDAALLSLLNPGSGLNNYNSNTDTRPPVGVDRQFHTGGLRWQLDTGRLSQTVQGQINRFREQFELDFRSPFTGERIFNFEILDNRLEKQAFYELEAEVVKKHLFLRAGSEYRQYDWELSMQNLTESSSANPNTPSFIDTINRLISENRTFRALYDGDRTFYFTSSAFAEAEILYGGFRITPGIRSDYYSLSRDHGSGPRLGVEYLFEQTKTRLLASASRHFAPPGGLEQISFESGNPYLLMEESDHAAGGIEQQIGRSLMIRIEGYHNTYRNLVVEDEWNHRPFSPRTNKRDFVERLDSIIETPLEARPLFYSNEGSGGSHGIELFLIKKAERSSRGFSGWLSFTASWTKRNNHQPRLTEDERTEFNRRTFGKTLFFYHRFGPLQYLQYDDGHEEWLYDNDREELYDLDRTYQASIVMRYGFNANWRLGGHWKYADNVPFTPIVDAERIGGDSGLSTYIPEYSEAFNSARLKPVHQLSVRLDHFDNYEWGYANWFIELINVYGHQNPEKENFNFLYPYVRGFNPEVQYESNYLSSGSRRLPLLNAGLEMRF